MAKKYLAMTDPAYKDAINTNNFSMLKLAVLGESLGACACMSSCTRAYLYAFGMRAR